MEKIYIPYDQNNMTIEQYNALDQQLRDIIELYEIVVQSVIDKNKIRARCSCGKFINTKYISNFISEDIYCSSCDQLEHGMEVLKEYAISRNGKCLSAGNYTGSKSYYTWKCNNCDNEWNTTWHSIRYMKSWCPTCAGSTSENICRHALEEITGYKFPKISNFAKSDTNRGFEIDCYNKELKVGVEYDGIQHHEHTTHFHGSIDSGKFEAQQDRDQNKTSICDEMGITLLRVNYTTPRHELRRHIHALIRGLNLPIELVDPANFISDIEFNNQVSKTCSDKSSKYMTRIMDIVADKKAVLHSTSCDSWKSPIEITCCNGHKFTTNLDKLFHIPMRWCPDCAHNRSLKKEHILKILEPKGFILTGMEYRIDNSGRNRLYISYTCDTYHTVTVMWDNHSSPDDRCPDCVSEAAVDRADANALIRDENRKPSKKEKAYNKVFNMGYIMGEYENGEHDLTEFRCIAHDHRFYDLPKNLTRPTNSAKEFCPRCILQNDFPNLEIDYSNTIFNDPDRIIITNCIECGDVHMCTNKSISERTQCCENRSCKYKDSGKNYDIKRSLDKTYNKPRTLYDIDQIINKSIDAHDIIKQTKQIEKNQIKYSKYQNHPRYIIPAFTSKSKPIELECRANNHKFGSKIDILDKYPNLEFCAQCILKNDYPYYQLTKPFDFVKNADTNKIYLICKCGVSANIQHKLLRHRSKIFCRDNCPYYTNKVRDIYKYNAAPTASI